MLVTILDSEDGDGSNLNTALSFFQSGVSCGFPSVSDDFEEKISGLDELLIKNPSATFLARASGESMIERGILDGSLLVIDRSLQPIHDATIVACIAGELTVKILDLKNNLLRPANPLHASIPLPEDLDCVCEGVVCFCITAQGSTVFSA